MPQKHQPKHNWEYHQEDREVKDQRKQKVKMMQVIPKMKKQKK